MTANGRWLRVAHFTPSRRLFHQFQPNPTNGAHWVQSFWADPRAITNTAATKYAEGRFVNSLGVLIWRLCDSNNSVLIARGFLIEHVVAGCAFPLRLILSDRLYVVRTPGYSYTIEKFQSNIIDIFPRNKFLKID